MGIFGGIFYMYSNYTGGKYNNLTTFIPQTEEIDPILVYAESGDVFLKTSESGALEKVLSSPVSVPNKTIVETTTGKASVLLPDNSSFSINTNTKVEITYTTKKISVYQSFGDTYHRVATLLSGQEYEVQTPGTLAAVRGTMFAVSYDVKNKKTKIAVTEHKVKVTRLPMLDESKMLSTQKEEIFVDEGKVVVVETLSPEVNKVTAKNAFTVATTSNDKDISRWVNANKNGDIELQKIKDSVKNTKRDLRTEIRRVLFKDTMSKDGDKTKDSINIETEKSADPTTEGSVIHVVPKEINTIVEPSATTTIIVPKVSIPVIKLSDDEFFSRFNDMFVSYFYLDETDSPCELTLTPLDRVNRVTSFAKNNDRPFTSEGLLPFAQAIGGYCTKKDPSLKVRLQLLFDDVFPYKENI